VFIEIITHEINGSSVIISDNPCLVVICHGPALLMTGRYIGSGSTKQDYRALLPVITCASCCAWLTSNTRGSALAA
jgi:hypothetical protein